MDKGVLQESVRDRSEIQHWHKFNILILNSKKKKKEGKVKELRRGLRL